MNSEALLNSMDIFDLRNESWEVGIQGGKARAGHTAVFKDENSRMEWLRRRCNKYR